MSKEKNEVVGVVETEPELVAELELGAGIPYPIPYTVEVMDLFEFNALTEKRSDRLYLIRG